MQLTDLLLILAALAIAGMVLLALAVVAWIFLKSQGGNMNRNPPGSGRNEADSPAENAGMIVRGGVTLTAIIRKPLVAPALIAVIAIMALAAGGALLAQNSTVGDISSPKMDEAKDITGNGKNSLEIPVSVSSALGTRMQGIQVNATASTGTAAGCTTDGAGECKAYFTPPKQANASDANIVLSAGNMRKGIIVKIKPDPAARITISAGTASLPADGTSGTEITIRAYDSEGTLVPDETEVTFKLSPVGAGSLSRAGCATKGGTCSVEYTPPTTPGKASVWATSYDASKAVEIVLEELPPASIELSASGSSVNADGKSTSAITAIVTNKIRAPLTGMEVSFTASHGGIQKSCTTDSSGKCTAIYTAPKQAGIARLVASTGQVSSAIAITLVPISDLSVDFSMGQYTGNPIIPAFAINTEYLNAPMARATLTNSGSGTFNGTISLSIPGWSSTVSRQVAIPPESRTSLDLSPTLNSGAFSNTQEQQVTYNLTVTDSKGGTVYQNSFPSRIAGFSTMQWFPPYYGKNADPSNAIIAAWVTPTAQAIHTLVSNSAEFAPGNSMQGYQKYSTGCGADGLSPCSEHESTYIQLEAIWKEQQKMGMHYVNAPQNFTGSQTVYTPAQSLDTGGQNCIDGTLVFASAAASMGMQAYIVLVPGHSFACIADWQGSTSAICIETTIVGSGATFAQAQAEGSAQFSKYSATGELSAINVNQALSSGIKAMPG